MFQGGSEGEIFGLGTVQTQRRTWAPWMLPRSDFLWPESYPILKPEEVLKILQTPKPPVVWVSSRNPPTGQGALPTSHIRIKPTPHCFNSFLISHLASPLLCSCLFSVLPNPHSILIKGRREQTESLWSFWERVECHPSFFSFGGEGFVYMEICLSATFSVPQIKIGLHGGKGKKKRKRKEGKRKEIF